MYNNVTSAVTKTALNGKSGSFSVKLGNCFLSLMCDGRLLARG